MSIIVKSNAVGQRIRRLRRSRAMTQGELGQELGISKLSVRAWENGHFGPGFASARKLAAFFNMDVSEFVRI